jgi:predicted nucleic acid-binding protein
MPDGPVVLNNTPLVALWAIGRLDLLRDLFGEILVPQAVESEFLAIDRSLRERSLAEAAWVRSVPLAHPRRALVYSGLDLGEAEVLALAEERDARLVVLDERKARRYAERLGLPITGTLGVFLLAKEAGLIDSVALSIDRLLEAGLYLRPDLVRRVLEISGESGGK